MDAVGNESQASAGTQDTAGGAPPVRSGKNGRGLGALSELPSGLAEALVAAVRQQASETAPHVAAALSWGWYLAALAGPANALDGTAANGELIGVAALTRGETILFCRSQVDLAIAKLTRVVEAAGLSLAEVNALRDCLDDPEDDARREAARDLDSKAIALLSAADSGLGKAYGVGRALMRLTTRPGPETKLRQHLHPERVAPIAAAIDDLSSRLPPHAGHSVRASLEEWRDSVGLADVAPESADTWALLARQGELWRTLLAGQKSDRTCWKSTTTSMPPDACRAACASSPAASCGGSGG
jgi:hypothetical protein